MNPETETKIKESSFSSKNLDDINTQEWKMLAKARLYAIAQWDEVLLTELNSPRKIAWSIKTMSWFEKKLRDTGIPMNVDFNESIETFRARAEERIITLSDGTKIYIEWIQPGENISIKQELLEKKRQQEGELRAKTRNELDSEVKLLDSVLWDKNLDWIVRSQSVNSLFRDVIKRVF